MHSLCKECNFHCLSHQHKNQCCVELEPGIQLVRCAFKNRIKSYRITSESHPNNIILYLDALKDTIVRLLQEHISIHTSIKFNMELFCSYILGSEMKEDIKSFNSRYDVVYENTNLEEVFNEFKQVLVTKSGAFQERDSGWSLRKILFLELNINKFKQIN